MMVEIQLDMLDNVRHSTTDFSTAVGKKVKELTDAITPRVQELFDTYCNVPIFGSVKLFITTQDVQL